MVDKDPRERIHYGRPWNRLLVIWKMESPWWMKRKQPKKHWLDRPSRFAGQLRKQSNAFLSFLIENKAISPSICDGTPVNLHILWANQGGENSMSSITIDRTVVEVKNEYWKFRNNNNHSYIAWLLHLENQKFHLTYKSQSKK